jgi:ABC-type dipeptide/oligopeptide/nickel transport system permease subunit
MIKKLSLFILGFWVIAVLAGRFLQLSPNDIDLNAILSLPNSTYLLGSDDLGRSILARLLRW